MNLVLRNQSFEVKPETARDDSVIDDFKRTVTTYQRAKKDGKLSWMTKDIYCAHVIKTNSFHFNNGELEAFIFHVKTNGYQSKDFNVVTDKVLVQDRVDLEFINKFEARDEQAKFIDIMSDPSISKSLVEARTGYGKTFMTAKAIDRLRMRTIVYIRPTHMAKWKKDLKSYFLLDNSDIFEIAGGESLRELLAMPEESIPPFIVCSNVTMREYFTSYTNSLSFGYEVSPPDFMSRLKIGLLVSDESHQFFHNLYMAITILNPMKVIGLSATLISKDKKMEKLYYSLFPDETRLGLKFYKKFTDFYFVSYDSNIIRNTSGDGPFGYNHNLFEQYILRNRVLKKNYFKMVKEHVEKYYITNGVEGDRLLVYAKSLNMIEALTNYLRGEYPNMSVKKYVSGSPYEDALLPDIRVSHPDKSGAALDIAQLTTVVNLINIDSPSQYLQMAGRLREIPGRDVKFVQLYSTCIYKHKGYIISNLRYINTMAKSISWSEYHNII